MNVRLTLAEGAVLAGAVKFGNGNGNGIDNAGDAADVV